MKIHLILNLKYLIIIIHLDYYMIKTLNNSIYLYLVSLYSLKKKVVSQLVWNIVNLFIN